MRLSTKAIVVLGSLALVAAAATTTGPSSKNVPRGLPVYLALGDSWAYGQGATDPAEDGYVGLVADELRETVDCHPGVAEQKPKACKRLRLANLARPATEELPGVTAEIVAGEQLPIAIPMLEAHNQDRNRHNDVLLVTLQVGGNDVTGPIREACIGGFTPECGATWFAEMAQFEIDLDQVVAELRTAAGSTTPIVLGTYDNPVPYCELSAIPGAIELGAMVLEGTPDGSLDGIHDVVRRVADRYNARVAEIFGSLQQDDFVGGEDCLHITDTGHAEVARTFLEVIEET